MAVTFIKSTCECVYMYVYVNTTQVRCSDSTAYFMSKQMFKCDEAGQRQNIFYLTRNTLTTTYDFYNNKHGDSRQTQKKTTETEAAASPS